MSRRSQNLWFALGAFAAALSVAFGAIGAHLIKSWVADAYPDEPTRRLELWDTSARYLMYAGIGLMAAGMWNNISVRQRSIVGSLGLIGASLFSGCLIGYVLTDIKPLVHIVPIGGFSMIASWSLLGWFSLANKSAQGESS